MSSGSLIALIIVTALMSSLSTLALGWIAFQWWLRPRLEVRLQAFAELLEARVKIGAGAAGLELLEPLRTQVRGGLEEAAVEWSPRFREELSVGFQDAAQTVLPAFREEVRKGFTDAIASLATSEILDRTARTVVRTGSSLMESGLSLLRGARPEHSPDEPPR